MEIAVSNHQACLHRIQPFSHPHRKPAAHRFSSVLSGAIMVIGLSLPALAQDSAVKNPQLPQKMQCQALQTVGLHDYAGAPESYEPSTFFESRFELRINTVLTRHLAATDSGLNDASPDLFLTLRPRNAAPIELRCRQVQGRSGELGYSCTNTPPSELLLINPANLRFTRTSIGGWTFSDTDVPAGPSGAAPLPESSTTGANLGDDSLFVEYGTCS